ncbi:hypothetical protein IV203_014391 [Nitzschia inconspicua]|uniref:Uncharacterized protein n=1 Tax=Nitzschia inconspicua TaxID=303405 RepID=A0A9K3L9R9_9STRA|nr:hypothetical protein IV203_014391 [Nitzschia inconspicua]
MKIFYPRNLRLSSLLLVIHLSSNVNARIGEQDDASRVNVQAGETERDLPDETPTVLDTVESQLEQQQPVEGEEEEEEEAVPPITERAWIYSFEDTSISSEMIEFDGTKSFIVVYKEPDPNEVGNAEDIIAATDFAVQSAVGSDPPRRNCYSRIHYRFQWSSSRLDHGRLKRINGTSSPVMSAPLGYFVNRDQPYVEEGCLPTGQYTFRIYDNYPQDGLEQGGFFELRVGGSVIFSSANIPFVWTVATHRFTIGTSNRHKTPNHKHRYAKRFKIS